MSSEGSVAPSAWFEPQNYRRTISEVFRHLDAQAQREMVNNIRVVPRYIHLLAIRGLVVHECSNKPHNEAPLK